MENKVVLAFEENKVVTEEEYYMLFRKVIYGIPLVGFIVRQLPTLLYGFRDEDERFNMTLTYMLCRNKLASLASAAEPCVAVSDSTTWLFDLDFMGDVRMELSDDVIDHLNVVASIIIYVILYFRYGQSDAYANHILPSLYARFEDYVAEKELKEIRAATDALPHHVETDGDDASFDNATREELIEMLRQERRKSREMKNRIAILEDSVKNVDSSDGADTAYSDRWYQRKVQVRLLLVLMEKAGLRIENSKTAVAILIANILHVPNFKSIRKLLSENFYLRQSNHRDEVAEINGLLHKLAAPFRLKVRPSRDRKIENVPEIHYDETMKFYNARHAEIDHFQ